MSAPSTNTSPASPQESGDVSALILQVRDLQRRVLNLEERLGMESKIPVPQESPVSPPQPQTSPYLPSDFDLPPNMLPVLGRMFVAIAGAYVLRALTEWGVLPAAAGVAIGLVYAFVWLWLAARSPVNAKFAPALSCCTSVLIMAPLIWEAAGHLRVMTAATSSGVLAAFALVGLGLGSRTQHKIIGTIAGVSSIVMAVALLLAHNDLVPYTAALLVIGTAMEFAACWDQPSGARFFTALAANFTIALSSYLISSPHGMPESWAAASPSAVFTMQLALAVIYSASILVQSVVRRKTVGFREIAQTGAAVLIGIGGAVWVLNEHHTVMLVLGIAVLLAGAVFYGVSFLLFERENKRNFRALSTFGLLLVLAGIFLPFSRSGFWIVSSILAVGCCWMARSYVLPTLGLHGAIYLALGSAAAGATNETLHALFSKDAGSAEWLASLGVLAAALAAWTAITGIRSGAAGHWRNQISSLALAAHALWIAAGLALYLILYIWQSAVGGKNLHVPTDTLGTVVLTGFSLALAWAGTHWQKPELVWILYGFMALGGYKLLTRDFVDEHNLPMVISLLAYGGALIVVPQMLRASRHQAHP